MVLNGCSNRSENYGDSKTAPDYGDYGSGAESSLSNDLNIDSYTASTYDENYKSDELNEIQIVNENKNQLEKKQMIIKNASIEFQVEDFEKSTENINNIVKDFNAYIASSNQSNSSYEIENTVVIRLISSKFDSLIEELMKESIYLNYKNITSEDVTEEFIDINVRLKTKKKVEKRFLDILQQARTIEDILAVENQLRVIREEIDAKEGRLKYLKDKVKYSTITLTYYEKIEYLSAPETGFFHKIFKAFKKGWKQLLQFIVGLVYIWPFLIILAGSIYLIRRWLLKRKLEKKITINSRH